MTERFYVAPYGRDCLGNITGYQVRDRAKEGDQRKWPVIQNFVGNIYKPGTHEQAKLDAQHLANRLNEE
jgi:hypothetical protein